MNKRFAMKYILLVCASILFYSSAIAMIPSGAVLESFNKGISQSAKEEKLEALIKNNTAPKSTRDDAAKRLAAEIFEDKIFVSESNRKSFMDPKLGLRVSDLNPLLSPEHALALNDTYGLVAYNTNSDSIELINLIKKFKTYSLSRAKGPLQQPTRIQALALSNDGSLLASVNHSGQVSIWDVPSEDFPPMEELYTTEFSNLKGIRALAFDPKDNQIAAGDQFNGKIYLLKLDKDKIQETIIEIAKKYKEYRDKAQKSLDETDPTKAVNTTKLYDNFRLAKEMATKKNLIKDFELLVDTHTPIKNLSFSQNGAWLAVRFNNDKENLVNMKTRKLVLPQEGEPIEDRSGAGYLGDPKEKQAFKEQVKLFEQVIEKARKDSKP
jgi:hypothetical protein